jgi:ribulose-phosphate 3-epimerase
MRTPEIRIAASMVCADHGRLRQEALRVADAGVDILHFDMMDGHFVENFGMTQEDIKCIRQDVKQTFDVHLALEHPGRYIGLFAASGADVISVHPESCYHLLGVLRLIKDEKTRAAVAINPATPVCLIEHVLTEVQMVVVMMVNPGFRGQAYYPGCLEKIKQIREIIERKNLRVDIEVDGGVYENTIGVMAEAGANVFVVGKAIFDQDVRLKKQVKRLRRTAEEAFRRNNTG